MPKSKKTTSPEVAAAPAPALEPKPARKRTAAAPKVAKAAPHKHTRSRKVEESTETSPVAVTLVVTHDDIAVLAYSYWEARGCTGGSAEEDWLRAERELLGTL